MTIENWPSEYSRVDDRRSSSLFDAVDKGFNLLTDDLGGGWVYNVDLDTLEVVSVYNCPLGQLYGSYDYGVTRLADRTGEDRPYFSRRYGFDSPNVLTHEYDTLTNEWKRRITNARKV